MNSSEWQPRPPPVGMHGHCYPDDGPWLQPADILIRQGMHATGGIITTKVKKPWTEWEVLFPRPWKQPLAWRWYNRCWFEYKQFIKEIAHLKPRTVVVRHIRAPGVTLQQQRRVREFFTGHRQYPRTYFFLEERRKLENNSKYKQGGLYEL